MLKFSLGNNLLWYHDVLPTFLATLGSDFCSAGVLRSSPRRVSWPRSRSVYKSLIIVQRHILFASASLRFPFIFVVFSISRLYSIYSTLISLLVKMHSYSLLAVALLAVSDLVAGHGAIVSATGDQGGTGSAIGSKPPHTANS